MDAAVQTVRTGYQGTSTTGANQLNPKVQYLRVTVGKQVAFLGLGFIDNDSHGPVEVWYSGDRQAIRIQNGRIAGASGLPTEWRSVVLPDFPPWAAISEAREPYRWVRVRDVMPGYRFGVRDDLAVRRIPVPKKTEMMNFDPKYLTWFEERFVAGVPSGSSLFPLTTPDDRVLPPARYGVDMRDGGDTVAYAEQCLSPDYCFTWQRWDFHMQPQKP
jgi:hypothetical protein